LLHFLSNQTQCVQITIYEMILHQFLVSSVNQRKRTGSVKMQQLQYNCNINKSINLISIKLIITMKTNENGVVLNRNRDWDLEAKMKEESWERTWEKTWKPNGEAVVSLIVRVGACSPSNDPSRRVLHIDSAIVECERF
jgi:hypothetical protein